MTTESFLTKLRKMQILNQSDTGVADDIQLELLFLLLKNKK